jgi:transcriptional regulator with XRE-family HTH domain
LHSSFPYKSRQIIGKKIRQLREQKNLTLEQLADLLGTDRQHIWNIEAGRKNITLDYLDKIAEALQGSQSEFLNTNI